MGGQSYGEQYHVRTGICRGGLYCWIFVCCKSDQTWSFGTSSLFVFLVSFWRWASLRFIPSWCVTAACLPLEIWVNFIFLPLVKEHPCTLVGLESGRLSQCKVVFSSWIAFHG